MAIKNICSIPLDWSVEEYQRHTCDDGSHRHLSLSQIREQDERGLVVWLVRGQTRKERSAVFLLPDHKNPVTSSPRCPAINTGLSYRVGTVLALAIYGKENWAQAMYLQIRMKREAPDPLEFQPFINS